MKADLARPVVAGGIAGFIFLALGSGVIGADVAHARAAKSLAAGVCATRPKTAATTAAATTGAGTAVRLSAFFAPADSTPSPSPDPSDSGSGAPAPTMSALASPTDSPATDPPSSDPSATSAAPDPSGSGFTPVPPGSSPSGSTSPSSSPSPSPSPSSSTSAAPSQLCVQVQSMSGASQVQAGTTAAFVVWVWSVGGPSKGVVVTSSVASAKNIASPAFTVCPQASGATCTLGDLPASQADELEATSAVGKAATKGEQVKLTAGAKGTGALSASASLALSVTTSPVASTSPPPGGLSLPAPPISLQPLPGLPIPGGVSGNPAGLFPTVAPAPTAGSGIGFPPARKGASRGRLVTASSTVPLSPGLIGGQLVGLAVLAAAIAIAIARLSLRRPRPQDGPENPTSAT